MHKLEDATGGLSAGPRLFTTASVRGILHNVFYTGKVKHHDQIMPGTHESLVTPELFHAVQLALPRTRAAAAPWTPTRSVSTCSRA